jgi:hypothetical protein
MKKYYCIVISLLVLFFILISPLRVSAQSVASTKFGIFYTIWHCPEVNIYPKNFGIPDVTEILAGNQTQANSPGRDSFGWAPIATMHFWGKPALGYYCLANNETVLRQHAKQLRDIGINFIFVDATNQPRVDSNAQLRITQPFDKLLQVWNTITDAPKVVVWVPVTDYGDTTQQKMVDYLTDKLKQYPNLQFIYQGKPLLLALDSVTYMGDGYMTVNDTELQQLSADFTVRRMWNLEPSIPANHWSAGQQCLDSTGFRTNGGNQTCNQSISTYNSSIEQISVVTAYQSVFMSDTRTATPKFDGKTLQKQIQTIFNHPGVPIVTIYGWNEFMAQRFCLAANGWGGSTDQSYCNTQNDHFENGDRLFVDDYNKNYSKDIEPAENDRSQIYYNITKACIALYKSGKHCDSTNASNVCCTVPTFIHGWVNNSKCIAVSGSSWNISGAATDDRDHSKKLTVRAEIYPDNEPYKKISFTSAANLGPITGLESLCPDKSCAYGINIPSLPLSFKDKKLRIHVFGVAADTEMELNMLKVPNNMFGPCNNLISSSTSTPTPTPIPGDIWGTAGIPDGHVDIYDFNKMIASFGNPYTILNYNELVKNFGT